MKQAVKNNALAQHGGLHCSFTRIVIDGKNHPHEILLVCNHVHKAHIQSAAH